jgi:hypothetical protein
MSFKSSPLDFIPTSLLKACCNTFCVFIANLANLSFQSGTFPSPFKTAQITPIVKRNESDPSSYRPISNLNSISKIIERLALARLVAHVNQSSANNCVQSTYKKGHSIKTTLLKLTDNALHAMGNKQSTILVALDQSAAFDCIDHARLLSRLRGVFGVSGFAQNWLQSCLYSRTSVVKFGSHRSAVSEFKISVPQVSALGPALYSLSIAPLANLIKSFGVGYHQYLDDTQLCLAASLHSRGS